MVTGRARAREDTDDGVAAADDDDDGYANSHVCAYESDLADD